MLRRFVMKSLLLSLLADPFGLSKSNLKFLLQIVEDEDGEAVVEAIEARLIETQISLLNADLTATRFFIKDD